jgi:hypothetical protein
MGKMTFEMKRINGKPGYSNFMGNGNAKTDSTEYDIPVGGKFRVGVALQIKNTLMKELDIPKERIKVTVEWE